jgi:hypothetical protein
MAVGASSGAFLTNLTAAVPIKETATKAPAERRANLGKGSVSKALIV